ncbi:unnamed protein product [Merluccius merluccius]
MPRPQSVHGGNKQHVEENQERRTAQLRKYNICPYNDAALSFRHGEPSPPKLHRLWRVTRDAGDQFRREPRRMGWLAKQHLWKGRQDRLLSPFPKTAVNADGEGDKRIQVGILVCLSPQKDPWTPPHPILPLDRIAHIRSFHTTRSNILNLSTSLILTTAQTDSPSSPIPQH